MKKIITVAALTLAAGLMAAPAHAYDDDPTPQGPVEAADNWNFSAGVVCMQEVAIVPVLGQGVGYVGDHSDNCTNGNIIDNPDK
ncbi:hypothetical protein ACIO3O_19615 [Streptomyces sp. NPDC087440]|uniref:hypothetical protein n=1 Tax=Streptomyces sp. NPDC087440 TaxID=3365790 RepID=UPI0037FC4D96